MCLQVLRSACRRWTARPSSPTWSEGCRSRSLARAIVGRATWRVSYSAACRRGGAPKSSGKWLSPLITRYGVKPPSAQSEPNFIVLQRSSSTSILAARLSKLCHAEACQDKASCLVRRAGNRSARFRVEPDRLCGSKRDRVWSLLTTPSEAKRPDCAAATGWK